MATLSADNKLRARVAAIPGTVILVGAGHPDRVVRFEATPECLKPFLTVKYDKDGAEQRVYPVILNLDRGPSQEAWAQATREVFLTARRDKPTPEALAVSEKPSEGWSLEEADVPLIENGKDPVPIASESVSVSENEVVVPLTATCPTCTVEFKNAHGLKIHRMRTKHT